MIHALAYCAAVPSLAGLACYLIWRFIPSDDFDIEETWHVRDRET